MTIIASFLLAFFHAGTARGQYIQDRGISAGIFLPLSDPPKTAEWLYVFDALMGAQGREGIISADAVICMNANKGVAKALVDLYDDPRFSEHKNIIARPFAGLQNKEAQEVAAEILNDIDRTPEDQIVLESARNVLRWGGVAGVQSVVAKNNLFGELPSREDIERWGGVGLCEILSEPRDYDSQDFLIGLLEGGSLNSGGRLSVCCALFGERNRLDRRRVEALLRMEGNPIVRDSLEVLVHQDAEEGEIRAEPVSD